MEAIGYGFLLGVGILLAVLAFCLAAGVFLLVGLFVGYVTDKARRADGKETGTDGDIS